MLAQRVQHVAAEAFHDRGRVHQRVAHAGVGASRWEQVFERTSVAGAERVSHLALCQVQRGVLAADGQLAGVFGFQAHKGLTVEDVAAAVQRAVVGLEAGFQLEDRRQAVAQVFHAFEADTRLAADAAGYFGQGAGCTAALADDTHIHQAVDGDVRLSLGLRSEAADDQCCQSKFFHLMFST